VRTTAAVLLPVLITVQALTLVGPFWPRVARDTFYPVTATHTFLRDHLGHERYAGTWGALGMGADTHLKLRALTGHTFVDARLGELVRRVPGAAGLFPTQVNFVVAAQTAGSPVLDRLGTRYFVTAPQNQVLGIPRPAASDGSVAVLRPGEPVTLPVPDPGPVRAVGLTPTATLADPAAASLEVTLRGADGRVVAGNSRLGPGRVDQQFLVPVAGEQVDAAEPLTATFTLRAPAPLTVQAAAGVPAVSTVGGADDGLRVAYAGSAVVYQRLTALPRIRWASDAVVQTAPGRRLDQLATGALGSDQVLLDAPGPQAAGRPARVGVVTDGLDEIVVDVTAEGAGYLVVADALQTGWAAEVDGAPAELLPAEHAVVAVPVPAGGHRVRLHYAAPQHNAGLWISAVAAVAALGLAGHECTTRRHRSGRR
jgi:hypothetical protein